MGRHGKAWEGTGGKGRHGRHGKACEAREGMERHGKAREAWEGAGGMRRHGKAWEAREGTGGTGKHGRHAHTMGPSNDIVSVEQKGNNGYNTTGRLYTHFNKI